MREQDFVSNEPEQCQEFSVLSVLPRHLSLQGSDPQGMAQLNHTFHLLYILGKQQEKGKKKICFHVLCNEKSHRLKSQILRLLIKPVASGHRCVLKLRFCSDALLYCREKSK